MWKYLVLALAVAGCSDKAAFKQAPGPDAVDDALAAAADDTAHDNLAGSRAMRLRDQGKRQEAVEVAGRIRDARIRDAVLAEVQTGGR